jgi:hypothetical protein
MLGGPKAEQGGGRRAFFITHLTRSSRLSNAPWQAMLDTDRVVLDAQVEWAMKNAESVPPLGRLTASERFSSPC